MTLHMMRGVSGSGKTTRANTLDAVVVSRDTIRASLTGRRDKFAGDGAFESKVTREQTRLVRDLLIARKDVVIDDTNLVLKHARKWANMANDYGHEFKVHDVKVSLLKAMANNGRQLAGGWVDPEVITRQFDRACWDEVVADATHPFVDWSPLVRDPKLPEIVTCDLDGTLAILADGYSPYDPNHYAHDKVNLPVEVVLDWAYERTNVWFLSGREDTVRGRKDTVEWLDYVVDGDRKLLMRAEGDMRRDDVVKVDLVNKHIRGKYNVLFHLDDRDRVVKALRTIGITVFQVAEGNF